MGVLIVAICCSCYIFGQVLHIKNQSHFLAPKSENIFSLLEFWHATLLLSHAWCALNEPDDSSYGVLNPEKAALSWWTAAILAV
jgi:hypothetical protein